MTEEFDFVIAGAGTAGCVLAARLAEGGLNRVCLVEAGSQRPSLWSRMPAGNGFLFGNKKHDWRYLSTPQPALGGRQIYYPRGRGVGGSSLLNGMIYIRGSSGDYNRWRQLGLPGWSYDEVLPYFKKSAQAQHRQGDPFHGDGPIKLTAAGNFDRINEMFVSACEEAGAPRNDDFNGQTQLGVGRLDAKVWKGRRQSAAEAYLSPMPKSIHVQSETHVQRILFEGGQAKGLQLDNGVVRARREVILCQGAFGSPQLLMLSGIGPAEHLAEHGIPVMHDLPGVGSRLLDHPQFPMKFGLNDESLSLARLQRIDRAALVGFNYFFNRSGPGAAPFWSSQLFHALRDSENPELQVYLTPMCVTEEGARPGLSMDTLLNIGTVFLARGKSATAGLQFDICLLRPKSAGSVRLASSDPTEMPAIDVNWFSDPSDMSDMIEGIRHMRNVAAQSALSHCLDAEIQPGSANETDAQLADTVRRHVSTGHHPVATCRMGPDHDDGAVLDAELRVRGVERLRVVDASSFPDQIGGNPNAPVMMVAEKAADMILGRPPLAPVELKEAHV